MIPFVYLACLLSLRCLISALTQAGGGDLLFSFASSVQSCCRKGGALQTDSGAVCGEHSPCSGHTGFAPHRAVCAFPVYTAQAPAALYGADPALSAVPVFGSSTKARTRLRLRVVSSPAWAGQAARGLRAFSRVRRAFSLRGPSARLSGSLTQDPGPVCRVGGGGFSGAEFAPSPPPASFPAGGSSLEFLSPLVLWTTGGVFRPVNFSLLSHSLKNLPPTALRAFWPVPTLRNAAGSSPFRPLLLVAGAGVWGTFLLGVAFRHVICGPYLISPPS